MAVLQQGVRSLLYTMFVQQLSSDVQNVSEQTPQAHCMPCPVSFENLSSHFNALHAAPEVWQLIEISHCLQILPLVVYEDDSVRCTWFCSQQL